ncbi:MAG: MBL fold metallo-hydrolase [Deltaproteobacteria bacterium]|jgi:glyoxylase-like metal-dependent hydrolase (beta-lactamase superfamily II)|nr:MAG: MBL fold metallo-hydrolase [Deltaproteobacteria bacterium]
MKVAPGIYQLKVAIPDNPLGNLNCYLVEGKEGWLMVDTGWFTPEAFDSLKNGLKDMGIALTDIATIVVTHVHPDHFGLAGRIKQVSPNTKLLTHQFEADLIETRYIKFSALRDKVGTMLRRYGVPSLELSSLDSSSMPALEFVRVTFPDRTLYGGEIIPTGRYNLEVIWTPGHSIGHICLYEPRNQLLFSGDHILPQITTNVSYHVQSGDNPLGDYLYSLHKLENLPVEKILPAHEDIFTDLRGRITELTEHHNNREAEIQKAILEGHRSAYEISSQITWNVPDFNWNNLPPLHKRIAVMEIIAHLECMRWEGKVQRIIEDEFITFRPR